MSKAGVLPSDGLMSYSGYSLGEGSYPSVEMQSVYSTALANWVDELHWTVRCPALWMLLDRFASLAWSMVLGLPDLAWSSRFLQKTWAKFLESSVYPLGIKCSLYFLFNKFFGCFGVFCSPVWTHKAQVPKLDYIARSSVRLSDHTQSEVMHNMSAH